MKIGDRICRKSNLQTGYIVSAEKLPSGCWKVWVEWDSPFSYEELPSEEIGPWDKAPAPQPEKAAFWSKSRAKQERQSMKKLYQEKSGDRSY